MIDLPLYDDVGINLADPHDTWGHKTEYITLLQLEALRRAVGPVTGTAADVGCGFGRLTRGLEALGYSKVIGIDPSERIIHVARKLYPGGDFRVGALPELPLGAGEVGTVFILNVMRPLHLLGIADSASAVSRFLSSGGRVVVMDNLRKAHPDYMAEADLVSIFASSGLRLASRQAVRGARLPWVPLLRFGLIPRRWYRGLASFELGWMGRHASVPRWQYINVIWIFEKP